MRIIHTADWHIGQTLAGYARDHEHRAVLKSLARIAVEREADALVVCGDVFDHPNPSGEAQRLLYEGLVELKRARPDMTIVLTAGNHDAAGRLEAPDTLLQPLGVRVVGSVRRVNGRVDARRHLVPLPGAGGEIAAHVLAVSYPTAACLPPSRAVDGEDADCVTRLLYAELVEACGAGRDGLPLILTGHLHVAGGLESEGSERRIFVGGEHAVSPAVFPDIAAYVALGHLHREQAVERATIRYSGSPLPLSATEIPYVHGVSLVTLGGGRVDVEHIPIERAVPFLRLPERGEMRLDEVGDRLKALGLPADLPVERRPFVQVWLSREGLEGPAASWRVEVERMAEPYPVRLVGPPRLAPALERATESTLGPLLRLADLRPEDLFCRAFAQKHGAEPGPEHIAVFHKVAAAAAEA